MIKLFVVFMSVLAFAESDAQVTTENPTVTGTTQTEAALDAGRWFGALELRPSYGSKAGEVHTENTLEGGYFFDKNTRLYYSQWFTTNVYSPGAADKGLDLAGYGGALRFRKENFWESNGTSLSYRAWAFTPTWQPWADAGLITSLRNDFKITQQLSEGISMDLFIAPIVHLYKVAGASMGPIAKANPIFTQRAVWNTDIQLSENLLFSFPLIYEYTRYRDYQNGAILNDTWGHFAFIWPELSYTIGQTNTIGVSYYSGALIGQDGALQIGNGLEGGVYQMVFGMML